MVAGLTPTLVLTAESLGEEEEEAIPSSDAKSAPKTLEGCSRSALLTRDACCVAQPVFEETESAGG